MWRKICRRDWKNPRNKKTNKHVRVGNTWIPIMAFQYKLITTIIGTVDREDHRHRMKVKGRKEQALLNLDRGFAFNPTWNTLGIFN